MRKELRKQQAESKAMKSITSNSVDEEEKKDAAKSDSLNHSM